MPQLAHGPMSLRDPWSWHVDIDRFINPIIPAPRWHNGPRPIAHMLGHRDKPAKLMGNVLIAFWSLIGAFCGVALVAEVSTHVPAFESRHAPTIIGSFGAAAVLKFCAIESPFSQPRNAFFGQMIACLVGVGISKLFALNANAERYLELGGALACALTTALMALTGTVHPPAGATALLAVTSSQTSNLGWFLFPVMILGIALMQVTALLINNIQRRFPLYWWTSHPLGKPKEPDTEEGIHQKEEPDVPSHYEDSLTDVPRRVVIERDEIYAPAAIVLTDEEIEVLKGISERI